MRHIATGTFPTDKRLVPLILLIVSGLYACNNQTASIPCEVTAGYRTLPQKLSETCLYEDIKHKKISAQLMRFTPNYQLWSDGAEKTRWVYFPENTQINIEDKDRWIFPVGTQFFKEFRQTPHPTPDNPNPTEIKVETRLLQKITPGEGEDSWLVATYAWNAEQTEAVLSPGASNVLGTDHDLPTEQDCIDCHKGNTDMILGFDAIQLSDAQADLAFGHGPKRQGNEWTLQRLIDQKWLSHEIVLPQLPGTPLEQKALGYLHANCGNCHNPLGHAAEQDAEHLKLRHQLAFDSVDKTDVYQTALNQPTRNFTAVPYILLGAEDEELALYHSAVFIRINSTDENYRMPMLAREKVDYEALHLLHQWMLTLPTPANFEVVKDPNKRKKAEANTSLPDRSKPLAGPGLQVEVQFFNELAIPEVMAIYWPEDHSLMSTPIMDHEAGHFTEKLLLGKKGSTMSLRNSDEVGHTIFVNDKPNNVKWQLSYMPPGSRFDQSLYWDEDVFVEMRCRLHLYMSAWIGSISSQYHKVIEFAERESYKQFAMQSYPENFTQLKIWLPKFKPINTSIKTGEEKSFDLVKGTAILGKIRIKRSPL